MVPPLTEWAAQGSGLSYQGIHVTHSRGYRARKQAGTRRRPDRYRTEMLTHFALGQSVIDLVDGHVGAREVHVGHEAMLILGSSGEVEGEVGGAATRAPGEVDEQGLGRLHAAQPVHEVLDALRNKSVSVTNGGNKNVIIPDIRKTEISVQGIQLSFFRLRILHIYIYGHE